MIFNSKRCLQIALFSTASLILIACDNTSKPAAGVKLIVNTQYQDADTGRWYSETQLEEGRKVFGEHCAICHGNKAEQTLDWKTPGANGKYPPPPLNGTAHAWHHPMSVLQTVIRKGGAPMGGVMPAWEGNLTESEIIAAIASFQGYWPNEIYQRWVEIDQQSRE